MFADDDFFPTKDGKAIGGDLVASHFLHRTVQFWANDKLYTATLPPYAIIYYHGAEADLRDLPLGTPLDFIGTHPPGQPVILYSIVDRFKRHELDGLDPTALQLVNPPKLSEEAIQKQRKAHVDFVKFRGVPAYVNHAKRDVLTLTFIGDPAGFARNFADAFKKDASVSVVVANTELRTWNPPVDRESGKILDVRKLTYKGQGLTGVQVDVKVNNLLEGFRKGHIVRVFGPGWPVKDQPYGESLMGYGYSRINNAEIVETPPREYPSQFPFRTDFGNVHLPWYKLKPDVAPPKFAEHVVWGELLGADAKAGTGHYRPEQSEEKIAFTLLPKAGIRARNLAGDLASLPAGSRCRFELFQDDAGAFTLAGDVSDDFSYLAQNSITFRIEKIDKGVLDVARKLPKVKDYNGDMVQPPDIGRNRLRVSDETRIWRGDTKATLADFKVDNEILVNLTAGRPGQPARCTDIWIGSEESPLLGVPKAKTKK